MYSWQHRDILPLWPSLPSGAWGIPGTPCMTTELSYANINAIMREAVPGSPLLSCSFQELGAPWKPNGFFSICHDSNDPISTELFQHFR